MHMHGHSPITIKIYKNSKGDWIWPGGHGLPTRGSVQTLMVVFAEALLWFALSMDMYNILSRNSIQEDSNDLVLSLFLQKSVSATVNSSVGEQLRSVIGPSWHRRCLVLRGVPRPGAPWRCVMTFLCHLEQPGNVQNSVCAGSHTSPFVDRWPH